MFRKSDTSFRLARSRRDIAIAAAVGAVATTVLAWPTSTMSIGNWLAYPGFSGDLPTVVERRSEQFGGLRVKSLRNAGNGFAALAYRGDRVFADFNLTTWIKCETDAPFDRRDLRGLAMFVDPHHGSFVRLACDYRGDQPVVNLARVSRETNNFPEMLASWPIPASDDARQGWRRFSVCSDGTHVRVTIDGTYVGESRLGSRGPLFGYLGVYTNHTQRRGDAEVQFTDFRASGSCPLMV